MLLRSRKPVILVIGSSLGETKMITKISIDYGSSVNSSGCPVRANVEVVLYEPTKEEMEVIEKLSNLYTQNVNSVKK